MRLPLAIVAAAVIAPPAVPPASAQRLPVQAVPAPEASAQGEVAVTIYNNDRALVQDRRELDLPRGRSRQEFPDVSARIRPETVSLTGNGLGIVEQNFDYDLLSPAALMRKAVGETITLVRVNPATGAETRERARVLAANGGVVLQIGDRIEVLLPSKLVEDVIAEAFAAGAHIVSVTPRRASLEDLFLTAVEQGGRR